MDSTSNGWKQCETTQLFGQPPHSPGDTIDFYIVSASAVAQSLRQIQSRFTKYKYVLSMQRFK